MRKNNIGIQLTEKLEYIEDELVDIEDLRESLNNISSQGIELLINRLREFARDIDIVDKINHELLQIYQKNLQKNSLLLRLLFVTLVISPALSSFSTIVGFIGYNLFFFLSFLTCKNIKKIQKFKIACEIDNKKLALKSHNDDLISAVIKVKQNRDFKLQISDSLNHSSEVEKKPIDVLSEANEWLKLALNDDAIIMPLSIEAACAVITILQNDLVTEETDLTTLLIMARAKIDDTKKLENISLKREKVHNLY